MHFSGLYRCLRQHISQHSSGSRIWASTPKLPKSHAELQVTLGPVNQLRWKIFLVIKKKKKLAKLPFLVFVIVMGHLFLVSNMLLGTEAVALVQGMSVTWHFF